MRPLCLMLLALAPAVSARGAGDGASISGTILPPGRTISIQAFEREAAKLFEIVNRYHKGTIDPKTGRFEIPNLPDGTDQLLIDCGGAKVEGVDIHIDGEEDGPVFDYVFKTGTPSPKSGTTPSAKSPARTCAADEDSPQRTR